MINIDLNIMQNLIKNYDACTDEALDVLRVLKDGTGKGGEYTGWVWLPEQYDRREFERVKTTAARIRENAEVFISVGIGGSYLGSRAAVDMLQEYGNGPKILFSGNSLTDDNISHVMQRIAGKEVYLNIVSKSGSTMEPMLAFDTLRSTMERIYGRAGAAERIICTTGKRGKLYDLAQEEGYECFTIPEDVGGRYSVLTSAGMLPMAVAGIDIEAVMAGARKQMTTSIAERTDNPALIYAAVRQMLYRAGKKIEIMAYPGERKRFFAEWYKQLFGESEGKGQRGLFPVAFQLTTDLHSLGQYIQDGERVFFETMLIFQDELHNNRFLRSAVEGVKKAHVTGGVPVIGLTADRVDAENFGSLVYFFEVACGISAYMMGVNPFDQPGVEVYKRNMIESLNQEQYEKV